MVTYGWDSQIYTVREHLNGEMGPHRYTMAGGWDSLTMVVVTNTVYRHNLSGMMWSVGRSRCMSVRKLHHQDHHQEERGFRMKNSLLKN